jgi:crotonobetainyl-CoA:carnitine CoA-transferase CaiB-like acyl-CoA transferase
MALMQRDRDGEAQRVDVAMHDSLVFFNQLALNRLSVLGRVETRGRSGTSQPYGAYRTGDGWVNIGVGSDAQFKRFCESIERLELVDDDRFRHPADRVHNMVELDQVVESWTTLHPTEKVVEVFQAAGVPSAPVFTLPQVVASPQVEARNMLVEVDDPIAGSQRLTGNPIKMSGVDRDAPRNPPPLLGGNTVEVLADLLELSQEQIETLIADDVVATTELPVAEAKTA